MKDDDLLDAMRYSRLPVMYVKDTDEKVLLLDLKESWYDDRDEKQLIAHIRFISDNPSDYALRRVGATGKADCVLSNMAIGMYAGHPAQPAPPPRILYTATVDVKKHLSDVPFGTKAAEVLFGKK